MPSISIVLRDGKVIDFPHTGRAGGSYTKTVRYEGAFVIVTDEYGKERGYPADLVSEVIETPNR